MAAQKRKAKAKSSPSINKSKTGLKTENPDITERKRAAKALHDSEENFRTLADFIPNLAWWANTDGYVTWYNRRWYEYTGTTPEQMEGWGWQRVHDPLVLPKVLERWKASIVTGDPVDMEFPLRGADGIFRFFLTRVVPLKDSAGSVIRWFGTSTDITDLKQAEEKLQLEIAERKKAEEALRESEVRYRSIFEGSNDGIIACDLTTEKFIFANKRMHELLGYTNEEITALGIKDIHTPKDLPYVLKEFSEMAAEKKIYTSSIPVLRKDASIIYCDIGSSFLGKTILVGFFRDVTERKQVEEALRQSREDLSRAQEVGNIGSWRLDVRQNVLTWSDESYRIFGIPKGTQLTYETFLSTVHPEDRAYVFTQWKAGLRGEPYDIEHRLVVGGLVKWVREKAYLEFDTDGSLLGGFGITQDITKRKQAEEEVLKTKDRLEMLVQERMADLVKINQDLEAEIAERKRAENAVEIERLRLYGVLETLPVYVVLLTRDYHVAFSNRFFRERFGESHGKRCFEYLFGRSEPCEICETYTVFKTMSPHHWEWTGPDKRNYDIFDFPFTDSDGSPLILEMGIDITAQKLAEQEIMKINQGLEQRVKSRTAELETVNKELEAFSYTISHDLKTPLRSIQGFARAITEDYGDSLDEAGMDYLRRINSAGERMTQLIGAMMELSRLTSRELMETPVNLSSIAEMIASELKQNEPDRKVEFLIAKEVKAHGDSALMEIVLRNLLDNALKFTAKHASAKIEFGVMRRDGKNVYFVRDDGAGFDMGFAGKLFQPFQRFHAEAEFPGIGIGLAIAWKIIVKHGGKIWAEAEIEKGATFFFTLG
jgi:PAS domain S-box-containing protein